MRDTHTFRLVFFLGGILRGFFGGYWLHWLVFVLPIGYEEHPAPGSAGRKPDQCWTRTRHSNQATCLKRLSDTRLTTQRESVLDLIRVRQESDTVRVRVTHQSRLCPIPAVSGNLCVRQCFHVVNISCRGVGHICSCKILLSQTIFKNVLWTFKPERFGGH